MFIHTEKLKIYNYLQKKKGILLNLFFIEGIDILCNNLYWYWIHSSPHHRRNRHHYCLHHRSTHLQAKVYCNLQLIKQCSKFSVYSYLRRILPVHCVDGRCRGHTSIHVHKLMMANSNSSWMWMMRVWSWWHFMCLHCCSGSSQCRMVRGRRLRQVIK